MEYNELYRMIQVTAENTLSIHLVNQDSSSSNDIKTFHGVIRKCRDEANKPGFTNMFDDNEKDLIRNIAKNILADDVSSTRITADRSLIQ